MRVRVRCLAGGLISPLQRVSVTLRCIGSDCFQARALFRQSALLGHPEAAAALAVSMLDNIQRGLSLSTDNQAIKLIQASTHSAGSPV